MVLACSRHLFLRPVLTMDQAAWTQSHVEAFAFLDGVPARLVPDNLRTGVERADMYDPRINRSYAELAAHYGVLIDPARADVAVRVHQSIGSWQPRAVKRVYATRLPGGGPRGQGRNGAPCHMVRDWWRR
jgi:hypothetical protein